LIIKQGRTPKDGGSAKGNVKYILGYSLSTKRELWEEKNVTYHALMEEAGSRPDRGVGVVWSPEVGQGVRPSSVYADNVLSLETADIEMQASAHGNKRVRSATRHEIFSFGSDPGITDEQAIRAALDVYRRVGFASAQKVLAVHRDTDHVHVHVARSSVDPITLYALNETKIHSRLDRAAREVEMARDLNHDRGLSVVRYADDGRKFVDDSTRAERKAWRREHREERIADLERKRYIDNERREGSFERWADATVEPRIRKLLKDAENRGEPARAIDVLNVAARYGTQLQVNADGSLVLRDVSTGRLKLAQATAFAEAEEALKDEFALGLMRDEELDRLRGTHAKELVLEVQRLEREGDVVPISDRTAKALARSLASFSDLADSERAQEAFAASVAFDPATVSRYLTQTSSTFTRGDVDRYLADRLDDVGDIEALSHAVFTNVESVVLMSPDVAEGVFTTREMLAIEQQIADEAKILADRPNPHFDPALRARVIAEMEAERSTPETPFRFNEEQRAGLSSDRQLSALLGLPGVGKTTLMEVFQREADVTGRRVVGVTLAQAAANRLSVEAGFECVNSAYAMLYDRPGREFIPRDGMLVVDEAYMLDSRTLLPILRAARERNTTVEVLGDTHQIPPIGAGGAFRILVEAAKDAGTYSELTQIHRQSREWHREAVYELSLAVEYADPNRFLDVVQNLEEHGGLEFVPGKDDAISGVVAWYREQRAKDASVLLVATDHETVRYLNEELIRQLPDRPKGRTFETKDGKRDLAVGDRFIFAENSLKLKVTNGDTGTVTEVGQFGIGVKMDPKRGAEDRAVKFDPRTYTSWDHGYATTVMRAQGASVRSVGGIVDSAVTAEAFNVLVSRSRDDLRIVVPTSAIPDAKALAAHLGARVVGKGTTQDIGPSVGPDGPYSLYAQNLIAQRHSATSPARRDYTAEWAALRVERDLELSALTERMRVRREAATDPLEKRALRAAFRREADAIAKAYEPEDFGAWLHRHHLHEETVRDRLQELQERRQTPFGSHGRTTPSQSRERAQEPSHSR
jgi:hypothetical protein